VAQSRPPDQLRPHPLNAAIYGDEPLDAAFRESIREEGIITPLVIDQDDTIISGHRRWPRQPTSACVSCR
jgi:ParB-like chromosome segregation protein Spo0J